jgi:methionine aminopeptidase
VVAAATGRRPRAPLLVPADGLDPTPGRQLGDIGSSPDEVIRPGDLLHCDFGLHYLGLATDTQQNAYVLRLGEEAPPAGLTHALAFANRQQDLLAAEMRAGRTGNEILAGVLAAMAAEGIEGGCTATRSASTATARAP